MQQAGIKWQRVSICVVKRVHVPSGEEYPGYFQRRHCENDPRPGRRHAHEHTLQTLQSSISLQHPQGRHSAASGWWFWALELCSSACETFALHVSAQAPACQRPICRRSFLLTQPLCWGSFSSRVLLSSHLKDNHIEILFVVFHINGSLSKGTSSF